MTPLLRRIAKAEIGLSAGRMRPPAPDDPEEYLLWLLEYGSDISHEDALDQLNGSSDFG
jgi:hypothetical protein